MIRKHHLPNGLAALIVILALIVGGVVSHKLLTSGAAVKTQQTAIDQNFGADQARVHLQGSSDAPFLGPYSYTAKHLECGPGVRLLEGALAHMPKPVRHGKAANCYGKATRTQVIAFQKRLHYKPTGVYNLVTHEQLVRRGGYSKTAKASLVYLYHRRLAAVHLLLVQHERATVKIVALHVANVGGSTLTYSQGGERSYFPAYPRIPPATDCSGMSTYILYQAGVGATIGYYGPGSPVGWTGTLRYQGVHINTTATKYLYPGDLIFYHGWGHVAVYIGGGLVVSHGGTGVNIESYSYSHIDEIRRYIA